MTIQISCGAIKVTHLQIEKCIACPVWDRMTVLQNGWWLTKLQSLTSELNLPIVRHQIGLQLLHSPVLSPLHIVGLCVKAGGMLKEPSASVCLLCLIPHVLH